MSNVLEPWPVTKRERALNHKAGLDEPGLSRRQVTLPPVLSVCADAGLCAIRGIHRVECGVATGVPTRCQFTSQESVRYLKLQDPDPLLGKFSFNAKT
jgi:hypothetical protein